MKLSLFTVIVIRKIYHPLSGAYKGQITYSLYTDGEGWLYDMRPNGLGKPGSLFAAGDTVEIGDSIQTIQMVEAIPPIKDQAIESTWEGGLAYSSSGFFGFRYFIGAEIIR
mgnify:CR=1 FL=1